MASPNAGGGVDPSSELLKDITRDFGSLDKFKSTFTARAAAVQGSGWAWLAYNPSTKSLEILTTPNQEPLVALIPVLGVDVWEHAYYLQYKNVRPDYLKAFWKVCNWKNVAERLTKAKNVVVSL
jgi:Fe-Mn family superoxide dismutase